MRFDSYEEARKKAAALQELDIDTVYLRSLKHNTLNNYPWGWVVEAKPGGFMRSGLNISFDFVAEDPDFDLTYKWSIDVEPPEANGSSQRHFDTDLIKDIMGRLPKERRFDFEEWRNEAINELYERVTKLENQRNRYLEMVDELDQAFENPNEEYEVNG